MAASNTYVRAPMVTYGTKPFTSIRHWAKVKSHIKSKEQLLSQCEEKDDIIMDLQQRVNNANEKLNAATEEFVKTEQAKNLEISHHQNQI